MARKIVSHDFFGGMNNKLPDHMIPEGQAKLLRNLFLDKDGVWKDIKTPAALLTITPGLLTNAVKIIQWFPQTVPADCIDDIVYIVFYSNGDAKMVYRGTETTDTFTILIKARIYGTTDYVAVLISGITVDVNSAATSESTPDIAPGGVSREYYTGTDMVATAPATGTFEEADIGFYRWADFAGTTIVSFDAELEITVTANQTVVAEYVYIPFIALQNSAGTIITSLTGTFYAEAGETSAVQSYYAGGVGLTADLLIYPPEDFEISLDEVTWVAYGSAITIAFATANAGMTQIFVRYAPPEEA